MQIRESRKKKTSLWKMAVTLPFKSRKVKIRSQTTRFDRQMDGCKCDFIFCTSRPFAERLTQFMDPVRQVVAPECHYGRLWPGCDRWPCGRNRQIESSMFEREFEKIGMCSSITKLVSYLILMKRNFSGFGNKKVFFSHFFIF